MAISVRVAGLPVNNGANVGEEASRHVLTFLFVQLAGARAGQDSIGFFVFGHTLLLSYNPNAFQVYQRTLPLAIRSPNTAGHRPTLGHDDFLKPLFRETAQKSPRFRSSAFLNLSATQLGFRSRKTGNLPQINADHRGSYSFYRTTTRRFSVSPYLRDRVSFSFELGLRQ